MTESSERRGFGLRRTPLGGNLIDNEVRDRLEPVPVRIFRNRAGTRVELTGVEPSALGWTGYLFRPLKLAAGTYSAGSFWALQAVNWSEQTPPREDEIQEASDGPARAAAVRRADHNPER